MFGLIKLSVLSEYVSDVVTFNTLQLKVLVRKLELIARCCKGMEYWYELNCGFRFHLDA